MIGALGYLTARSIRNRLVRQLARLRTPRYAIALVLGLGYLWLIGVHQRPHSTPAWVSPATVELLASAGVVAVLLWTWIFGAERTALAFTPAEVTLLFPAPITRRQLIRYKLLRGQLVILFNVVLWTLLLPRGWGAGSGMRALAIWLLLTTLSLHRLGAALLRSSLLEHGRAAIRRQAVALLLVAIAAGALLAVMAAVLPVLVDAWGASLEEFLAASHRAVTGPAMSRLLLPFRLMVRPLLADDWSSWSASVVPAVAILALHYVWVIRSEAAFEESAAAASLARARTGARRSRPSGFTARPVPLLAPTGWPASALLWKNLVALIRTGRARSAVIAFAGAGSGIAALSLHGGAEAVLEVVGWLAAMWGAFLLVLGPQWVRNDLRGDLTRVAVLRGYPLRGRAIVGAETAASTLVLTALQLGLAVIAWLALSGANLSEPSPEARTAGLVAAMVFLPAINFLAMLIQNGAALILPGWVHTGAGRATGVEALGQNMLVMSGFLLILCLLLIPPAAAASLVFLGIGPPPGWWAAAPAALAALVIAGVEASLLLSWLGRVFEQTDPASVPPAESA